MKKYFFIAVMALSLTIFVRVVASLFMKFTVDSQLALRPNGSPYVSMNPFTKSTSDRVSSTHKIEYASNVFRSPVR